jgi:hypothetical protein
MLLAVVLSVALLCAVRTSQARTASFAPAAMTLPLTAAVLRAAERGQERLRTPWVTAEPVGCTRKSNTYKRVCTKVRGMH